MNLFGGIYKQSAYFRILYQVSKGLFNKSLDNTEEQLRLK